MLHNSSTEYKMQTW